MTTAAASLTALEIASGLVFDPRPPRRPRPLPAPAAPPPGVLRAAVLPALLRPPCLVSFSGGRDSSLVLAAATRAARAEGLADPIPVTNRFAGVAEADESRWQEQLVADLGLTDWQRLEHTDELDAVGPYAERMLRAHGLLWPFNVHFHLPLLDLARGGALLTGLGGDQLLGALAPDRRRSAPRRLAAAAVARAPRAVRAAVIAQREPVDAPWLRPAARRAAARAMAREYAAGPRGPRSARMAFELSMRYLGVTQDSLAVCADAGDVLLAHPLCAPGVWAAAAGACPPAGFASHERALRDLFGDLLPAALAARRDKASFDGVFSNEHGRAFAARWEGGGVPCDLVDVDALREQWRSPSPPCRSLTLMQAARLAEIRMARPSTSTTRTQRHLGSHRNSVPIGKVSA